MEIDARTTSAETEAGEVEYVSLVDRMWIDSWEGKQELPFAGMLRERVTLSSRGRIVEGCRLEADPALNPELVQKLGEGGVLPSRSPVFPEHPVKVGDTWSGDIEVSMPSVLGGPPVGGETTYELLDVRGRPGERIATIGLHLRGEGNYGSPPYSGRYVVEGDGTQQFDIDHGYTRSSELVVRSMVTRLGPAGEPIARLRSLGNIAVVTAADARSADARLAEVARDAAMTTVVDADCLARIDVARDSLAGAPAGVEVPLGWRALPRLPSGAGAEAIDETERGGLALSYLDDEQAWAQLPEADRVLVMLPADTGIDVLRDVFDSDRERVLLLGGIDASHAPPPSGNHVYNDTPSELEGTGPRAVRAIAEYYTYATGLCSGAIKAYSAMAFGDPGEGGELLRRGLDQGLRSCGCEAADVQGLTWITWLAFGGPELRAIRVPLAPRDNPDALRVPLPSGATLQDAMDALSGLGDLRGRRVRVMLEEDAPRSPEVSEYIRHFGGCPNLSDVVGPGESHSQSSAAWALGDGPEATRKLGPLEPGGPVRGALSKEHIRSVIRSHLDDVRGCYEGGQKVWQDAEGRLSVSFVIGPSGAVDRARVEQSDVPRAIGCCVRRQVERWQFDPPDGGGIVVVTYPFVLQPGDGG